MLKRIKEKKRKKGRVALPDVFIAWNALWEAFVSLPSLRNLKWFPLRKYSVAAVATVAEIGSFLSRRRLSPLLLSSVFPYTATVTETQFSTTGAIVTTGSDYMESGL